MSSSRLWANCRAPLRASENDGVTVADHALLRQGMTDITRALDLTERFGGQTGMIDIKKIDEEADNENGIACDLYCVWSLGSVAAAALSAGRHGGGEMIAIAPVEDVISAAADMLGEDIDAGMAKRVERMLAARSRGRGTKCGLIPSKV